MRLLLQNKYALEGRPAAGLDAGKSVLVPIDQKNTRHG
jgi:hypothetical protein